MSRPRVLLADDHRMMAEGLKALLPDEFELVGIVEDGRAMILQLLAEGRSAKEIASDLANFRANCRIPQVSNDGDERTSQQC